MIYDPATDTTNINYGHPPPPPPPESPLQREWRALVTTLLVILLAPVWLAYKAYEKCHEWQQDRTYASQEEVMKQPPVVVMVCKLGCPAGYSVEEMMKLRVVSRQLAQESGSDLIVLAPSKGDQWITCQVKAGESFNHDNLFALTTVCCLFEGPGAWEQARPIGNLPEKPLHMWGEKHCPDHSIREDESFLDRFPANGSYVTAWYDYQGKRYVYQDGGGFQGFWRAKPADEVYLEALRNAGRK